MQDDRVIELIAKSLDEPLNPVEQDELDAAMEASVALRLTAEGLREFDALLRRTGMAIPADGFPARVLARIEAYEKRRSREEWLLTLGVIFLGLLAAIVWLSFNYSTLLASAAQTVTTLLAVLPVWFGSALVLGNYLGSGPLLVYALIVLALTVVWARLNGDPRPEVIST
jgi:hypothetical protein